MSKSKTKKGTKAKASNVEQLVAHKGASRIFPAILEHFFGTASTPLTNPVTAEQAAAVETHIRPWKQATLQEGADVDDAANHKFAVSETDCPHKKRKRDILRIHPEISTLAGYEPATKYLAACIVVLQLYIAYGIQQGIYSWPMTIFLVYFVGAVANHCGAMIIHECSHNLAASTGIANRAVGFLANIALAIPSAASFRRYHLEHHAYQGVRDGPTQDADLPADFEIPLVRNKTARKVVWLWLYGAGYAMRAILLNNTPSTWEVYNLGFTICCNALIVATMGWSALSYLLFCSFVGLGLHPVAGHFIQEHFTFVDGQETYSCYGPLNIFSLNVGYHNEHHDFADIPWSRLSLINKAAPEFYNRLSFHTSWSNCIYRFITDNRMGAFSRLIRSFDDHRTGRRQVNDGKGQ